MLHEMAEEHPNSLPSPATYKRRNTNQPTNQPTSSHAAILQHFTRLADPAVTTCMFITIITQLLYRIWTESNYNTAKQNPFNQF
jgi:hypothetical protein